MIYSRTPLFRTRLNRSPRYFEERTNSLGFTLPLYASPVISKPRYFELFFHFPWDFEIAGFDCTNTKKISSKKCNSQASSTAGIAWLRGLRRAFLLHVLREGFCCLLVNSHFYICICSRKGLKSQDIIFPASVSR